MCQLVEQQLNQPTNQPTNHQSACLSAYLAHTRACRSIGLFCCSLVRCWVVGWLLVRLVGVVGCQCSTWIVLFRYESRHGMLSRYAEFDYFLVMQNLTIFWLMYSLLRVLNLVLIINNTPPCNTRNTSKAENRGKNHVLVVFLRILVVFSVFSAHQNFLFRGGQRKEVRCALEYRVTLLCDDNVNRVYHKITDDALLATKILPAHLCTGTS